MKKITEFWKFFDNLNEFVYAVDVETYEIVYMNQLTMNLYGLQSAEDYMGRKCYELLQGSEVPCGFCTNHRLNEGQFVEWKHYNPIIEKYTLAKDTLVTDEETGRVYRVEIAVDVSEENKSNRRLLRYESMEKIINEGLRIALRAETSEDSILILLEYLGRSLNGARTYIFEKNQHGRDDNTYEWTADGVKPEQSSLQNLDPAICQDWYRIFEENKTIIFRNIEDVRTVNPIQYKILKRQHIHSLVVVPLYDDHKVIGFYGVDNPPVAALDYTSDMLQIMAHFIVSCIRRRNLMRQLKEMSCKDAMTQLGNRFALHEYIAALDSTKSIGVVYCDITGLKHVNDTQGHDAGDRLILRASSSLQQAFEGYPVFRIGGDELLVFCSDITEQNLEQRIFSLKTILAENDVVMATGAVWREQANVPPEQLMQESEQRMYQEKRSYYQQLGIDRRT